jgi:DNA-binding MarR family transcriptional regulator
VSAPEPPLSGLFGDDELMLAVPVVGDAWEAAEREVSARLSRVHDLRLSDLLALDRIQRAGRGGIRTNALARALRIPSNRLTYQLAGLQKRRLIHRAPDPEDGRGIVLTLTPAGREAHRKALATYRRMTHGGLDGMADGVEGTRLLAAAAILSGRVPDADVARLASGDARTRSPRPR